MSTEYYIAAYNFPVNSTYTPNYDMEASSYWANSGATSSLWYSTSAFFYGSKSLAFQISGGAPYTEIDSYTESHAYDNNPSSYGCQNLFDGLYPQEPQNGFENQWFVSYPTNSEWFQVRLQAATTFRKLMMMGACNSYTTHFKRYANRIQVDGSNVGSFTGEQTILYPMTSASSAMIWTLQEWKTFNFTTLGSFMFYRVWCRADSSYLSAWMQTAEAEFYEW